MNVARKSRAPLLLLLSIVSALLACPNVPAGRSCSTIQHCETLLRDRAEAEERTLSGLLRQSQRPKRPVAIVGDGIAGIAAPANLIHKQVRVYGRTSFWSALTDLPEVWQTNLDSSYVDAGLQPPSPSAGRRLSRDSVILANLRNLVASDAAYLATGSVMVTPGARHSWTIIDADGNSESISDLLIVATGVLRPLRITDVIAGTDSVRRELMQAGRVASGDDCVTTVPVGSNVVGILGAGGSAADCAAAVLRAGAPQVVVWGKVDSNLTYSKAYDSLVAHYPSRICLIEQRASSVQLVNGEIVINNVRSPPCGNPASKGAQARQIDFLVESLGRYSGDPPPVVASAGAGSAIIYEPVLEPTTCALIAVRVYFSPGLAGGTIIDRPPLYLIGAAASWIPPDVRISATHLAMYKAGRDTTVAIVNRMNANDPTRAITIESGPPSFAVAAFMGAHLARYLNAPQPAQCPPAASATRGRGAGQLGPHPGG